MKKFTLLIFMMLAASIVKADYNVVFKGSFALGYDDPTTVKIPSSAFSNLKEGDVVIMVVSSNVWCKMMKGNWDLIQQGNATDNMYKLVITADLKNSLQESGLYIQGNPTLYQVRYGSANSKSTDLYTNSEGYQINKDWSNSFDISGYDFSSANENDVLTFTVECTATEGDWHPLVIRLNSDEYKQYNTYGKTTIEVIIDDELLRYIQEGADITGDQFKLKGINYRHEKNTYALDANNNLVDLSTLNGKTVNVELTRNFDWNSTICLPFDVADVSTAFDATLGSGVKAYEYTSLSDNTLTFTERESISAGVPYYMVRPYDAGIIDKTATISFEGVTINTNLNNSETISNLTFKGNYTPAMNMEGKYGVASVEIGKDNWVWGFYKGGSGSNLNAFSAYFDGTSSARFAIRTVDSITGVEEVKGVKEQRQGDNIYYNLSGQRVANPSNGIYILNGKKVIVK